MEVVLLTEWVCVYTARYFLIKHAITPYLGWVSPEFNQPDCMHITWRRWRTQAATRNLLQVTAPYQADWSGIPWLTETEWPPMDASCPSASSSKPFCWLVNKTYWEGGEAELSLPTSRLRCVLLSNYYSAKPANSPATDSFTPSRWEAKATPTSWGPSGQYLGPTHSGVC